MSTHLSDAHTELTIFHETMYILPYHAMLCHTMKLHLIIQFLAMSYHETTFDHTMPCYAIP